MLIALSVNPPYQFTGSPVVKVTRRRDRHPLAKNYTCAAPEDQKAFSQRKQHGCAKVLPVLIDESSLPRGESALIPFLASFRGFAVAVADSFCASYRSRSSRVLDRHPHHRPRRPPDISAHSPPKTDRRAILRHRN